MSGSQFSGGESLGNSLAIVTQYFCIVGIVAQKKELPFFLCDLFFWTDGLMD